MKVLNTQSLDDDGSRLKPELIFHDDIFNATDEIQNVYEMSNYEENLSSKSTELTLYKIINYKVQIIQTESVEPL